MSGLMRYRPWSIFDTKRSRPRLIRIRWTKEEIYPVIVITLVALIVMLLTVWLGFTLTD
jgi:hypothetical protein